MRGKEMKCGQLSHSACSRGERLKPALEGFAGSEHSMERLQCFLKTEDKYSQEARVIRNVTATFVFMGAVKTNRRDQ